jgi:hypothetical protein
MFLIPSDDRLILLVPQISSPLQELPHALTYSFQVLATIPKISTSCVDLKVTELAHAQSLPASTVGNHDKFCSLPFPLS